jgi:fructosamine-3-kinase
VGLFSSHSFIESLLFKNVKGLSSTFWTAPGMFEKEAESLNYLGSKKVVNIPSVYFWDDKADENPAYIVMEWVGTEDQRAGLIQQGQLGEELANLHKITSDEFGMQFGLWFDNYIGSTVQINPWTNDWIHFFRDARLLPQIELAVKHGKMNPLRRRKLDKLVDKLDGLIGGISHVPSLLHGDLWGGNVVAGKNQLPYLIDPAIYYGDREADLAFTELFGGFSKEFYDAYQSNWPLEPGYSERKNIYNLYHLLNHLNLFGESYGGSVDSILNRYA